MKQKIALLLAILLVLIVFSSCERKSRPVAARKGTVLVEQEKSEDASKINVHNVSASVGVQEVLPSGPGKQVSLDGAELYKTHCSACHQLNGAGLPPVFPPLVNSPYVEKNDERMASIMLYGLMGPINVLGTTYNGVMTAVGISANLSPEELSALSGYVRSSWGNKGSAIPASVFESVKKKYGTRGPFNIQELGEEK